jgi:hypothetical protein
MTKLPGDAGAVGLSPTVHSVLIPIRFGPEAGRINLKAGRKLEFPAWEAS